MAIKILLLLISYNFLKFIENARYLRSSPAIPYKVGYLAYSLYLLVFPFDPRLVNHALRAALSPLYVSFT